MTDNRTNLPEGTDKVIGGASTGPDGTGGGAIGTGTSGAGTGTGASGAGSTGGGDERVISSDTTLVTETEVRTPRGDSERPTSGSGTPGGSAASAASGGSGSAREGGVLDKVRSGSEKLGSQAADKAKDLVSQGLERSADALSNVGRLIGDTATGLDERLGPEYGEYARRAASTIDDTANRLKSKDPDELIDDTRDFVRKSPAVALAGAAIIGFALARLVKTGFESARGSSGERGGDRTGGSGGGAQS